MKILILPLASLAVVGIAAVLSTSDPSPIEECGMQPVSVEIPVAHQQRFAKPPPPAPAPSPMPAPVA
ncbi:MAG: hypothetical protein H0V17_29775 [Deltaproteobacteria bacterium]|nr:hypothetical protein [Deltaproteobacteria bacterium]